MVSGSAADRLDNGSIGFQLQNTGSAPATIEQVAIDVERGPYAVIGESNAGDCNLCHEMVFRGTDDGYYEAGDDGSAYPLEAPAMLQDTATLDPGTTMTVNMSSFRNNGGQEKDVTGARVTVTITYADGSTAEYTFTPA